MFQPFNAELIITNTPVDAHSLFMRRGHITVLDSSLDILHCSIHTIYNDYITNDSINISGKLITSYTESESIGPLAGTLRISQVQHSLGGGTPQTGISASDASLTLMNTELNNCGVGLLVEEGTHFHLLSHSGTLPAITGTSCSITSPSLASDIHGLIEGNTVGTIQMGALSTRTISELLIEPICDTEFDISINAVEPSIDVSPIPGRTKTRVICINEDTQVIRRGDIVCLATSSTGVKKALSDSPGILGVALHQSLPVGDTGQVIISGSARVRMEGSLTVAIGDPLYVSSYNPGLATNTASVFPGDHNVPIGYITSVSGYSGASGDELLAHIRIESNNTINPLYLTLG